MRLEGKEGFHRQLTGITLNQGETGVTDRRQFKLLFGSLMRFSNHAPRVLEAREIPFAHLDCVFAFQGDW